jgi:hypothetical protein
VVRARILPLDPAAGKGQKGHDPAPNDPPATATLIVTAALLASLAGLVLSQAGAATAGATTAPGGSKPTVVLVHGAWADSGSSDQVVARLQRQGDPVIAFPSPRRSLPDDRAELAAFRHSVPAPRPGRPRLRRRGHHQRRHRQRTRQGAGAGRRLPPRPGRALAQLLGTRRAPVCPAPHRGLRPAALPGARPGVVDTDGNQGLFPSWFANDLPARTGGRPGRHPAAISTVTLGQPSGPPAWAEMPSWALVGTVDRVILPATQRFLAERAGARIVKVKASPLSLISRPGPVTGLIVAADRATR